jgi:hypothetical protein
MVVTGLINRVEVVAAIARAGQMKLVTPDESLATLRWFRSEWESFHRLPITENTVMRGDFLAVEYNLRGLLCHPPGLCTDLAGNPKDAANAGILRQPIDRGRHGCSDGLSSCLNRNRATYVTTQY